MSAPPRTKIVRTFTVEYDPEEMARRGRLGALARLAKHDAAELTKPARDAFMARFEQEVDPNGVLPPEERQRRAEYARKLHFTRMAHKSAQSRRRTPAAAASPAEHPAADAA